MTHAIGILIFCYLAFGVMLYAMQRSFIYFPTPVVPHGFEELDIESDAETIKLVVLNQGKDHALLYFGGNAEAVVHNGPEFEVRFPEHTVYLVNYRGYGGSSGNPTETGLFVDALHIHDHLASTHDSITLLGRSLGSGVASYVAAERAVAGLVLITPFDSIENVASGRFPIYPISILLKDKYDSASRVIDITADVLVVIAGKDNVIPRKHTDALLAAFSNKTPKTVVFEKASHNDISQHDGYYAAINDFLSR